MPSSGSAAAAASSDWILVVAGHAATLFDSDASAFGLDVVETSVVTADPTASFVVADLAFDRVATLLAWDI